MVEELPILSLSLQSQPSEVRGRSSPSPRHGLDQLRCWAPFALAGAPATFVFVIEGVCHTLSSPLSSTNWRAIDSMHSS